MCQNINTTNIIAYKKANATLKREIKIKKRKALYEFTSDINPQTPIPKIWKKINRFCGLKTHIPIHCLVNPNNAADTYTNKYDISKTLCEFWSKASLNNNFHSTFRAHKENLNYNFTHNTSPLTQPLECDIQIIELKSAINQLKGKTPGRDRISYPMIKNLPDSVMQRLLNLYNNILNAHIPQQFKISNIIPILKPDSNKTEITSYRPISLNSCLSKVMDKIISKRLWWLVNNSQLLDSRQMGFRKGKSVSDSLAMLDYLTTTTLSRKGHLSIISLDFSKAFDKIGMHTIIDELVDWKLGPKMIKYTINFLTNRKICVQTQNAQSQPLPLENGIPQGSPLSVILFAIAYNKLNRIIGLHKSFEFTAYADDYTIIRKQKKKETTLDINPLLTDIQEWCNYSGASLSIPKSRHLHICRKKKCNFSILSSLNLKNETTLKILGITITNKYKWDAHIEKLVIQLAKRLNIIKCLCSTSFNCHIKTILDVINSIIMSKIDFGLFLYGRAPKSKINKIKTIYHSAVRMALGAFRSSPINNLLYESNIKPIEHRTKHAILKNFKIISTAKKTPLEQVIKKISKAKRIPKLLSTIKNTIDQCNAISLHPVPIINKKETTPTWAFNFSNINKSLHISLKPNTSPIVYYKKFLEMKDSLKQHTFLYTDGSKSDSGVAFSVTSTQDIITQQMLPPYSSIFTAEISAILYACRYAEKQKGKFAICSDSLAALTALENPNNHSYYTLEIRKIISKYKHKFTLIWVPGHCGIIGNELADQAAKQALTLPLILEKNHNIPDTLKYISKYMKTQYELVWNNTSPHYKLTNPKKQNNIETLNPTISRIDIIKFMRLRIGHTKLTHSHLFDKTPHPTCQPCNHNLSLHHIFLECPLYTEHRQKLLQKTLEEIVDPKNIVTTIQFLKSIKLYNSI